MAQYRDTAQSLESYSSPGSGLKAFHVDGLGTHNTLLLGGADDAVLGAAAQEAFETLERLEQLLSKFLPQSDVSLLNVLGADRPVRVGPDLLRLLELAREAWEITGGAFDPAVGALMEAWGLVDMEGRIPAADELARLRARGGMGRVGIDAAAGVAWLDGPGVAIDLGGIGKGYVLDAIARGLERRSVPVLCVISGRSSIVTRGLSPGETAWTMDVVDPGDPDETHTTLLAEPGSLSTSGAYARRFLRGGKEYGHVLDPRTGAPAHGVRGVTVWTETAVLGDVLSTALFVLGREALAPGGPVERLVSAWRPDGGEGRASILLLEEDSARWGGLRSTCFHIGRPAFRLLGSGDEQLASEPAR